MEGLLLTIGLIFSWFGLISGFFGIISFVTLVGYFLIRIILKIFGLYSATPDQVKSELKATGIFGFLVLFTISCFLVMELVGYMIGSD